MQLLVFRWRYLAWAILLFAVEAYIALYVRDRFIRPIFGDFLVVILIYCFLRAFLKISVLQTSIFVLLLAYFIEFTQYLNLVKWLGWQNNKLANLVLGNTFQWEDMIAYTLGVIFVYLLEKYWLKN